MARKKKHHPNLKYELAVLACLAVGLLMVISIYFSIGGIAGRGARHLFFGLFGIGAYFLPVYVIAGAFLKLFNKGNAKLNNRLGYAFLFIVDLSVMAHLAFSKGPQIMKTVGEAKAFFASTASYYYTSAFAAGAGGIVGGLLSDLFEMLLGKIGSFIVLVLLAAALAVLATERSLLAFIKGLPAFWKQAKALAAKWRKERKARKAEAVKRREAKPAAPKGKGKQPEKKRAYNIVLPEEAVDKPPALAEDRDTGQMAFAETLPPESGAPEAQAAGGLVNAASKAAKPEAAPAESIQNEIQNTESAARAAYRFPPIDLLKENRYGHQRASKTAIEDNARKLEQTLESFGVKASVVDISVGPAVTRYELQPETGVKVSKIVNLSDDIALNLSASGIRIEAPIPGKPAVGIEVPNKETSPVLLREVIETGTFSRFPSKVAFALGKDISGKVVVADIAKMPHLLVAGATGSGKSVCINALIMSIIYKASPEDVKLLMIDPKVVELSVFNGIPHLMIPVVVEPRKAAGALNWAVQEMSDRYKLFAEGNVRDIRGYNQMVAETGEGRKMPQIVIIVDELADLMMASANEVEDAICRLAQMARAAGIHLVIATQRPSVDVITGLIKANIPSRIAFSVSSGTDSRTIIDSVGAEKLLGKGDMLFYPVGLQKPVRLQGAFVTDKEVEQVVAFVKKNAQASYNEKIMEQLAKAPDPDGDTGDGSAYDPLFNEALELVVDKQKASASMIQRRFRVGYNRAARIVDQLHEAGFVGDEEGSKPRNVLLSREAYRELKENNE